MLSFLGRPFFQLPLQQQQSSSLLQQQQSSSLSQQNQTNRQPNFQ
ncbi:MAG: hypothetical protein ACJ71H_00040 [Nitrososphaeraceae archaeon]